MNTVLLDAQGLACEHAGQTVFSGVSFQLQRGEIAALLGPSGSGKTTLLRALAGLHPLAAGALHLRGSEASRLPPEKRGLGFVFQDLALFPHLSVAGNVSFGLSAWSREKRSARVHDMLQRTGLSDFHDRMPHQLSGGQQQRVALARALAPGPDLLLLDEPLSSLDADLRPKLREELRAVLKDTGTAALMVTHDQDEAFAFAETVGVMLDGRLAQWGSGYALYHQPASTQVARFVGDGRLLSVRMLTDTRVMSPFGALQVSQNPALREGDAAWLLLRPDDIVMGEGDCEAQVESVVFHGSESAHVLRMDDGSILMARAPSHQRHHVGERVRVRPDLAHVVLFPA